MTVVPPCDQDLDGSREETNASSDTFAIPVEVEGDDAALIVRIL